MEKLGNKENLRRFSLGIEGGTKEAALILKEPNVQPEAAAAT